MPSPTCLATSQNETEEKKGENALPFLLCGSSSDISQGKRKKEENQFDLHFPGIKGKKEGKSLNSPPYTLATDRWENKGEGKKKKEIFSPHFVVLLGTEREEGRGR